MKIIKKVDAWWDGKQGQCKVCGTVVELEVDDPDQLGNWRGSSGGAYVGVAISCPTCGDEIRVLKDPPKPKNGF